MIGDGEEDTFLWVAIKFIKDDDALNLIKYIRENGFAKQYNTAGFISPSCAK